MCFLQILKRRWKYKTMYGWHFLEVGMFRHYVYFFGYFTPACNLRPSCSVLSASGGFPCCLGLAWGICPLWKPRPLSVLPFPLQAAPAQGILYNTEYLLSIMVLQPCVFQITGCDPLLEDLSHPRKKNRLDLFTCRKGETVFSVVCIHAHHDIWDTREKRMSISQTCPCWLPTSC